MLAYVSGLSLKGNISKYTQKSVISRREKLNISTVKTTITFRISLDLTDRKVRIHQKGLQSWPQLFRRSWSLRAMIPSSVTNHCENVEYKRGKSFEKTSITTNKMWPTNFKETNLC